MKNTDNIKVRRNWGSMSPVTKVKDSNRVYSRKNKHRGRIWMDLD